MGSSVYSPAEDIQKSAGSILENYITAQKAKQAQAQEQSATEAAQADAEHRQNLAKQTAIQLETEHERNLQALKIQQAQLDSATADLNLKREQLQHAHLSSVMDIQKGITEGSVPVPPQQFQPNPSGSQQVNQGTEDQPILVNGQNVKPPLTYGGVTLQPNEYNTPTESIAQTQPLVQSQITNTERLAEAQAKGTATGTGKGNSIPGGLYEQQKAIEDLKTINAQKIADVAAKRAETVANINAAARETAAHINAQSRITAAGVKANNKQIDPDALEERMTQLAYGEGKPIGSTPLDMAAASGLRQAGKAIVTPKTVDNIKTLKPLENFSADMTDFANKFLGDGALSGLVNAAKLNSPITTDEKNQYNQLMLNSTNIAKGIEGATGRILMAQVQTAKDFIANKNIDKSQLLQNAQKLNSAVLTALEGQLGNMKPADRVDFLSHHGFDTLAAYEAARWKIASPGQVSPPDNTISTPTIKKPLPDGVIILGGPK